MGFAGGLGYWNSACRNRDEARVDKTTAMKIFDRALELGVTFWDTAPRYNNASGNSERVIGEWFNANPDQRRNIVIATKVYGGMDGLTPNHCRLTRGNLKESVYASLERMQIDTIDLLYLHHYDPITPPEETFSALEDLIEDDLVRYLAISNFSIDQFKLYQSMELAFSPRSRILAVQTQYDMLRGEHPDYPACWTSPAGRAQHSLPTARWRRISHRPLSGSIKWGRVTAFTIRAC